jgi:exonuclease III
VLLITWNTNRRRHAAPQQARVLLDQCPDIVALQEVTVRTAELLARQLTAGGLSQVAFSLEKQEQPHLARGPRAYGVLLATRFQLARDPTIDLPVPWKRHSLG